LLSICAIITPRAIISHRSALASTRISPAGNVFLTGPYRRDIQLPGIKLRILKGPGALDSDIRIPTFGGEAFISSQARALLENLTPSRGDPLLRMLARAARFSNWVNMTSKDAAFADLKSSNSLERPDAAKLTFGDSGVPSSVRD